MARQLDVNLLFNEEVDQHHRALLEQYDKLSEAVQQGNSSTVITQLSGFLCDYSSEHFDAEDKLMVQHCYPQTDPHRREHRDFERDITKLKKKLELEGPTRKLAVAATGILLRWIVQHVNKSDVDMVAHFRKCQEPEIS